MDGRALEVTERTVVLTEADINTVKILPLSMIRPNPDQPRKFFKEERLILLSKSYEEERDVDNPIPVTIRGDGKWVMIIDGERRWRAAKLAGLTEISCHIKKIDNNDIVFLKSTRANFGKEDMTPMEEADSYQELKKRFNWGNQEVANHTGKSLIHVTNVLKYLKLTNELKRKLEGDELSKGYALHVSSWPKESQHILLKILQKAEEKNGNPLQGSEAARVLALAAEKLGIKKCKNKKGRKIRSHAELVVSHVKSKCDALEKALKELAGVDIEKIKEIKVYHPLDLLNNLKNTGRILSLLVKELDEEID